MKNQQCFFLYFVFDWSKITTYKAVANPGMYVDRRGENNAGFKSVWNMVHLINHNICLETFSLVCSSTCRFFFLLAIHLTMCTFFSIQSRMFSVDTNIRFNFFPPIYNSRHRGAQHPLRKQENINKP